MANNAETEGRQPALLLTRPRKSAVAFLASLDPACLEGREVCISPLLEIVPTGNSVDLSGVRGVVFSSANGVAAGPQGAGRPAFCVGQQTARAAAKHGWQVTGVAQDADGLVALIRAQQVQGPLVHLAGAHRRGAIAERLSAAGIETVVSTIYDQRLCPLSEAAVALLRRPWPVLAPLFSPRTAAHFASQLGSVHNLHVLAISPAVAEAFTTSRTKSLSVAPAPTAEAMREGVEMLLRGDSLA